MDIRPVAPAPPSHHPVHAQPSTSRVEKLAQKMKSRTGLIVSAVVVLAVLVSGFFIWQNRNTQKKLDRLSHPQAAAQVEAQQLVDEVGKLAELPKNETPTVATVSDVSKLKGQTFFNDAQSGDKALIYTQAKKAVLYRPSTNKIINIATLDIDSSSQSTQSSH